MLRANLKNKLPDLSLSGYLHFDNEDLDTFTKLTHLTKIQSIFLQSSAMPVVNSITKLTNLRTLSLASLNIVVEPNPFLRSLTNLTCLEMQIPTNNHIIAEDMAKMTQLREFYLLFQQDSEFPTSLFKLTDLQYLRFKKLLTIPPTITKFGNLRALAIDSSTDELPPELALMTQLCNIQIRASSSITTIPDVIFQMTWLTQLSFLLLSSVRYIPSKISRLTQLKVLIVHHCAVVTLSYEDLAKLTQLQTLNIVGLSCKWVPPRLSFIGVGGHVQGGSKIPGYWQERRRYPEFSRVHLDLYDD